jgi:hypothetical protein
LGLVKGRAVFKVVSCRVYEHDYSFVIVAAVVCIMSAIMTIRLFRNRNGPYTGPAGILLLPPAPLSKIAGQVGRAKHECPDAGDSRAKGGVADPILKTRASQY